MRSLVALSLVVAACGPKVDARSPFDEDDPRAGTRPIDAAPAIDAAVDAPASAGARTVSVSRAAVVAVLDAGPGELLRTVEVAAERSGAVFRGWRLVRFLPGGERWAAIDLAPTDLIVTVNGHTVESPPDLGQLWTELRTAPTIDAVIERGGAQFTIHADVTP
jgi:hypothetical protein